MMKRKDHLDKLADVAEEMNEVIGLEPAIDTEAATKSGLEEKIKEASELIDWDIDEFSKDTMKMLENLGIIEGENSKNEEKEVVDDSDLDIKEPESTESESEESETEEEELEESETDNEELEEDTSDEENTEEEDEDEETLEEIVKGTKRRKALKRLAKTDPTFESLRSELKNYDDAESLREAMLAVLSNNAKPEEPETENTPEEPVEEKEENTSDDNKEVEALKELVENTTKRKELKKLVKTEPLLELLRPNIKDYSNAESLKEAILAELDGGEEPDVDDEELEEEEEEEDKGELDDINGDAELGSEQDDDDFDDDDEEPEPNEPEIEDEQQYKAGKPKIQKTGKSLHSMKAMNYVRKWTCENPDISVKELIEGLEEEGFTPNVASVTIRRNEMRHAVRIMKELGKLKK